MYRHSLSFPAQRTDYSVKSRYYSGSLYNFAATVVSADITLVEGWEYFHLALPFETRATLVDLGGGRALFSALYIPLSIRYS